MSRYTDGHKNSCSNSRLVYATDQGSLCPKCGESKHQGACDTEYKSPQKHDSVVRIQRQTKGRKGKGVTLITGLPMNKKELDGLAKQLKKQCGTGGTVKDGVIEIQGDYRERLLEQLSKLGIKAKLAGG